jgi:hypothetical protein
VNDSEPARRALARATGLAKCLEATVTVLHVREPGSQDSIRELRAWVPEEQRNECSVVELSGGDDVAREFISLASESEADLLGLKSCCMRYHIEPRTTLVVFPPSAISNEGMPCPLAKGLHSRRPLPEFDLFSGTHTEIL